MQNLKINVWKQRNSVFMSLYAFFQDGRQNHTESYIVVDSLFNVPRNNYGVLCWSLFFYTSLCVLIFLLTP